MFLECSPNVGQLLRDAMDELKFSSGLLHNLL
jgi:hypothetical protein